MDKISFNPKINFNICKAHCKKCCYKAQCNYSKHSKHYVDSSSQDLISNTVEKSDNEFHFIYKYC